MINNKVSEIYEIHEIFDNENLKRKKCSSCLKMLDNPKVLPCRHKFCLICLLKLEDEQINGKIKCAVCEIGHEIPSEGISNFPSYYDIKKLLPNEDSNVKNAEALTTLECPICYETLENPRFLPCFHKFCLECVQKLEQAQVNGKIKCPLCRKEHFVTNESQITPNLSLIIISPESLNDPIQSNPTNTVQTRSPFISSSRNRCGSLAAVF